LDRLKATLVTAFLLSILLAPTASAQTAQSVQIISGNGQLICPTCAFKINTFYYPMVVKVTDASGNPISGKTVNWQQVSFNGGQPVFNSTTTTDVNGLSLNLLSQGFQFGSIGMPFLQSVISATADTASATFTETQALTDPAFNAQLAFSQLIAPVGVPLTGPAGSTGTSPIVVHIDARGVPIPNVSLRILSPDPKNLPSASCATGAGADPGSVLTDASGNATCYPVFGPVAGSGVVAALLGGLDPAQFDQTISPQPLANPIAYDEYTGIQIAVTAVNPGLMSVVSGNNQTVNPGQTSAPLVVKVTDATGAVTIANLSVAWTVSPAGAATLSQSSTTTNAQGQTQTTVTFSPSAVGQVSVKAALTGANSSISTTFTLSANVQISSITKVSGDQQSAQAGQSFGAPLVVQVMGTNGQPVVGQSVSFSITGGATLSATSALTDATGKAQVTVKAGATAGAVTVSAFIGSISQNFSLTIIPPGPVLSTGSFYNAGGLNKLGALSPCSLVTVLTSGLAPNIQGLVLNTNAFGPWGTTLANDTVTVNNVAAPIYSVGNVSGVEQLTFEVPCETAPAASVPIAISVGGGSATVNMPVQSATPGIFQTVMSDGVARAVVIRPDGSFVTLQNPARRGETVRVFVTGLGPATPPVATGAVPVPGTDSLILGQVIVGVANGGTPVFTSRVSPNLIGVNEVSFQVPANATTGNDVVLSVAVNVPNDSQTRFSNASRLPIQ
jgi:uncharacterized protein (TIGR03437 family)